MWGQWEALWPGQLRKHAADTRVSGREPVSDDPSKHSSKCRRTAAGTTTLSGTLKDVIVQGTHKYFGCCCSPPDVTPEWACLPCALLETDRGS